MRKIVVDTNFLLMPYEYRIDLVSELRRIIHSPITLVVSQGTLNEISMLSGRAGRKAAAARFILSNMEKFKSAFGFEIAPDTGAVDKWILKHAQENLLTVATNDVPLRKRLLAKGVPVIAMKGKSKLEFV